MPRSIDTSPPPLRLWPGVLLAVLTLVTWWVLPRVVLDGRPVAAALLMAGSALILLWWLLASRVPWSLRLGALALAAAMTALTYPLVDESIATGMMGYMLPMFALPTAAFALVVWAVWSRASRGRWAWGRRARWVSLVAILAVACGSWALVRTGGFTGDMDHDFAWRWAPTPEDELLEATADEEMVPLPSPPVEQATAGETEVSGAEAKVDDETSSVADAAGASDGLDKIPAGAEPAAEPATTAKPAPASRLGRVTWTGFRGRDRAGVVTGTRIATDWNTSPPVELWRRPVGPAWSSFAVAGDVLFTQEQRGDHEAVSAYRLSTGEPVWRHEDETRFWESNAGPGPRGTPALAGGRVFSVGANGLVNALDAATGAVLWAHDAARQTGAKLPTWGFSSSPLVVGDTVVVAMAGDLVAYDAATGETRWERPAARRGEAYTSPQLADLGGRRQILMAEPAGLVGIDPASGDELWSHEWPGYPIVQPALTGDDGVLLAVDRQTGLRRVAVERGASGWATRERWTSNGLKPYFNDFVVHEGHAYGFDGRILSCIDLETGDRKWKGGRYGNGQMLLLVDQDLLLVLSEEGELALVRAAPDGFQEAAAPRPALDGKTWNHPALVGDVLLVRNGEEMVAYRVASGRGGGG